MANPDRPTGLTALAVFNFCAGALFLIQALSYASAPMVNMFMEQAGEQLAPEQRMRLDALADIGVPLFLVLMAVSVVRAVLLIVSGIGYLRLKKVLGRKLGNIGAIVGLLYVAASIYLPPALGGGFTMAFIIGLVYPLFTLLLLNMIFREDFIN